MGHEPEPVTFAENVNWTHQISERKL
jgi:hypothetical protein